MNRLDALHRVARHAAWHPLRDLVVLRGGLVMRRQIQPMPRPIDDVDFLIRVDSFEAFRAVFAAIFPASPLEVTWAEMERPGLRTRPKQTAMCAVRRARSLGFYEGKRRRSR